MKILISSIKYAIVAGLLLAALDTFIGVVYNDSFTSESYAEEEKKVRAQHL